MLSQNIIDNIKYFVLNREPILEWRNIVHLCNLQWISLNTQAYLKAEEIGKIIFHNYHFCDKIWSNYPTAPYTTTVAEAIIASVMDCSHLYSWKQIDVSVFQVMFQDDPTVDGDSCNEIDDNTKIMSAPIPLFSRKHTVQVNTNKVMFCDCYLFESIGIFCVHMVCVCKFWQRQIMKYSWGSLL